MKNSFFTILLILIVSFSFAQEQDLQKEYAKAKFKTIDLVNQLDDVLRLNDKQKAILTKHFSKYTHNVVNAQDKLNTKIKNKVKDKIESKVKSKINKALNPINNRIKEFDLKKQMNLTVMKYAKERDENILKHLKPRQIKKYNEFMNSVNPITLEINEKKIWDLLKRKKK